MMQQHPSQPTHHRLRSRDTGFAQGIAIGQFDDGGIAISGEQLRETYRRKGLCVTCGKIKTHTKKTSLTSGFHMAPTTRDGEVYEGYCLKCHTLEEVLDRPEIRAKLERKQAKKNRGGGGRLSGRNLKPRSLQHCEDNSSDVSGRSSRSLALSVEGVETTLVGVETSLSAASGGGGGAPPRRVSSTGGPSSSSSPRGVDEVVQHMLHDPTSARVQARGCGELSKLPNESDALIGAIDAIVDAMHNHPDDGQVQKEGCRAFRRYTTKTAVSPSSSGGKSSFEAGEDIEVNADACSKISVQGGVYATVAAMRNHGPSRSIQREACRVLRNVLCALSDGREAIIDTGGIEAVIKAMWTHDGLESVQEDGCIVLWSLCYDDGASQGVLLEKNGVGAILNGMTRYVASDKVQYHGCGALHTLSSNENLKRCILDNGGFDVIVNSIKEHGYSEAVAEKACGALVNLVVAAPSSAPGAGGKVKSKLCVMNDDEIDAIVSAMQIHEKSCRVQQIACYLLEIAARCRSNLNVLRANPKIRAVLLEASGNFPDDCVGSVTYVMGMIEGG